MSTTQKNPNAYRDILKRMQASPSTVAMGLPAEAPGTGKLYPETGVSVVEAAEKNRKIWHFMRDSTDKITEIAINTVRQAHSGLLSGAVSKAAILTQIGGQGAAVIQNTIIDMDAPPNSPATIAKKGESNPLVETGLLTQSITFTVRE